MRELVLSIMYVFRQVAKFFSTRYATLLGGNVDWFYGLAIPYVIENRKHKKRIIEAVAITLTLLVYFLLQIIFIDAINVVKVIVNITKIIVCFFCFRYTIDHIKNVNLIRTLAFTTGIYTLLTVMALVFSNSTIFWRFNDNINKFSLVRLQLAYLEPSELGYHIILVMLPLIAIFILTNIRKVKFICGSLIGLNAVVLYLAKPLGAIAIGFLAIVIMIAYDFYLRPSKKKIRLYILILIIGLVGVMALYLTENPIIMRIIYTLQGKDSSNNYRVGTNFKVFIRSFAEYKFLGCGFGNLNTPAFIERHSNIGLTTVVVNSFIYFIIETGILGLLIVLLLIIAMIKNTIKGKSLFKIGLTVFITLYSFVGGHFTSAITWVMYGIIFSDYSDEMLVSAFECAVTKSYKKVS